MSKWTPEPWHACSANDGKCICRGISATDGTTIATFYATDDHGVYGETEQCCGFEEGHANRHHAVACVNALAGLNPEAVAEVVRLATTIADEAEELGFADSSAKIADAIDWEWIVDLRLALAKLREVPQ